MTESSETASQEIVARAGKYYRNVRYIICAMVLGAGILFAKDGWIKWPNELRDYELKSDNEKAAGHMPHGELDIALQKRLAIVLIPLAPILLGFFFYRSRGEYRLSGTTLYVPGHPPVPFEAITAIDKAKWQRKGIACVDYKLEGGEEGRLTLDDFIYAQTPTDKIVERLDHWLNPEAAAADDAVAEESEAEENADSPEDVT